MILNRLIIFLVIRDYQEIENNTCSKKKIKYLKVSFKRDHLTWLAESLLWLPFRLGESNESETAFFKLFVMWSCTPKEHPLRFEQPFLTHQAVRPVYPASNVHWYTDIRDYAVFYMILQYVTRSKTDGIFAVIFSRHFHVQLFTFGEVVISVGCDTMHELRFPQNVRRFIST